MKRCKTINELAEELNLVVVTNEHLDFINRRDEQDRKKLIISSEERIKILVDTSWIEIYKIKKEYSKNERILEIPF